MSFRHYCVNVPTLQTRLPFSPISSLLTDSPFSTLQAHSPFSTLTPHSLFSTLPPHSLSLSPRVCRGYLRWGGAQMHTYRRIISGQFRDNLLLRHPQNYWCLCLQLIYINVNAQCEWLCMFELYWQVLHKCNVVARLIAISWIGKNSWANHVLFQ